MNNRIALAALVGSVLLASAPLARPAAAQQPPNVVLIMADDLGWSDLACYGNRFHVTPHIDALAGAGHAFHRLLRPFARLLVHASQPARGPVSAADRHHPAHGAAGAAVRQTARAGQRLAVGPRTDDLRRGAPRPRLRHRPRRQMASGHRHGAPRAGNPGYGLERFSRDGFPDEVRNDPEFRALYSSHLPKGHGFDFGPTTPAGGTHFFPLSVKAYDKPLPPDGTYLADFLTDLAVEFIEQHRDGRSCCN